MSRHNYTNPAFCQDEMPVTSSKNSPARVHRSESIRSFHSVASTNRSLRSATAIQRINSGMSLNCSHHQQHTMLPLSLPPSQQQHTPKLVNKQKQPLAPHQISTAGSRYGSISDVQNHSMSGRYALVPVEELASNNHGRYAVLPAKAASRFISKSQENLDRFIDAEDDGDELPHNYSDQFTSLPPISSPKKESSGMMPAFSTDFGSKSFILFDQKNQQRYAVVPTEENEEIVDDNHEIIQMHNGKAHRYAVIPTDEEETCLNSDLPVKPPPRPPSYAVALSRQRTPQKQLIQNKSEDDVPSTPKKNPIATQKLYELLSTPQKTSPFVRQNSTPITPKNSPYRVKSNLYASNPRLASTPSKQEFTPQRLQYDEKVRMASTMTLNMEQRTTAVIQPRMNTTAASVYNETTTTTNMEKSWNKNLKSHKQAIATIGFVSLLLMLCGVINSGLCIYMTSVSSISALYTGRSYFLDIGIMSAFATVALSFLGFKYRHSEWLPNRHYISGFIMMTFFAIMNCGALTVLLIMKPVKGFPLHDVTTGISLALSLLILLLISLGVISSRLCRSPPPDNRIDIC